MVVDHGRKYAPCLGDVAVSLVACVPPSVPHKYGQGHGGSKATQHGRARDDNLEPPRDRASHHDRTVAAAHTSSTACAGERRARDLAPDRPHSELAEAMSEPDYDPLGATRPTLPDLIHVAQASSAMIGRMIRDDGDREGITNGEVWANV